MRIAKNRAAAPQKRRSIALSLAAAIFLIVVVQSVIWICVLCFGGILDTTRQNAYSAFSDRVGNRRDYLQVELKNRRASVEMFTEELTECLDILGSSQIPTKEAQTAYFEQVSEVLTSMMRTTVSTGAFVILNDNLTRDFVHSAMYLRDYDPFNSRQDNADIFMAVGPSDVSTSMRIQLDSLWSYTLTLTPDNSAFYDNPYNATELSGDASLLGYWSEPFSVIKGAVPAITYSMPMIDKSGAVRGVCGIDLTVPFIRKLLPSDELSARDPIGYMLGGVGNGAVSGENAAPVIMPMLTSGEFQEYILNVGEPLELLPENMQYNTFLLKNHNFGRPIYSCVQKIQLYEHRTPFENDEWYIAGFITDDELLEFLHRVEALLAVSSLSCAAAAAVLGVIVAFHFTRPITALANVVSNSRLDDCTNLANTGYREIDELTDAIEAATKNYIETADKVSRIIEMVDVPIGVFECRESMRYVFTTDRLDEIFSLSRETAEKLYSDRQKFVKWLSGLMSRPESEEENVYKICDDPEKWVRIFTVTNGSDMLGIATDVTYDVSEKRRIKLERDYDFLTRLRSMSYFRVSVEHLMETKGKRVQALMMLDLDKFKLVNDTYGHEVGDDYLCALAKTLKEYDDERSIVGRRSGDEFLMFFHGFTSRAQTLERAREFFRSLAANQFTFPDGVTRAIAVSGGLCWRDDVGDSIDDLLEAADRALYRAKHQDAGYFVEYQIDDTPASGL